MDVEAQCVKTFLCLHRYYFQIRDACCKEGGKLTACVCAAWVLLRALCGGRLKNAVPLCFLKRGTFPSPLPHPASFQHIGRERVVFYSRAFCRTERWAARCSLKMVRTPVKQLWHEWALPGCVCSAVIIFTSRF